MLLSYPPLLLLVNLWFLCIMSEEVERSLSRYRMIMYRLWSIYISETPRRITANDKQDGIYSRLGICGKDICVRSHECLIHIYIYKDGDWGAIISHPSFNIRYDSIFNSIVILDWLTQKQKNDIKNISMRIFNKIMEEEKKHVLIG